MMRGNDGMTVNVNRQDLILVLKKNLEKHKAEYLEAVDLYYQKVEADLKKLMKQIKSRDEGRIAFMPTKPSSYEENYLDAIDMLEMSVDENINLDTDSFRKFVKDQWDWKASFDMVNSTYKSSK